MPGAFAHLTLVKTMVDMLDSIPDLPTGAKTAYLDHSSFSQLGAVSPDYPYLALDDGDAPQWADNMHYIKTGDVLKVGVRRVAKMPPGDPRNRCLAWLLGYSTHVAADVTIHPVVERKVGIYQGHETAHRICEMHQDAYIYQRLNLDQIGLAEPLRSGIARCGATPENEALHPDISGLWGSILSEVYPGTFALAEPDFDLWHRRFITTVDRIEEGHKLLPIARHVAVDFMGATYPTPGEIDAITGATQTSRAVEAFLNREIAFIKERQEQIKES